MGKVVHVLNASVTRQYAVILVVTVKGYESKLKLPLTTGHGMSALHIRQAVWLSGVSSQATFYLEDAKYFFITLVGGLEVLKEEEDEVSVSFFMLIQVS